MLLSDVVKVLGDRALGEFPWGCVVKDTVNLFAAEPLKLKLTSTGPDLTRALDEMSETNRTLLHNAQLDASRSCMITDVGGGMVVAHGEVEPPAVFGHFQFFTALVVGLVIIGALVMFSNLSINSATDWKEVGKIGWTIVKSLFTL
jgi:hypothetical protein